MADTLFRSQMYCFLVPKNIVIHPVLHMKQVGYQNILLVWASADCLACFEGVMNY